MALVLTGTLTFTCSTVDEYSKVLADVNQTAVGRYTNITGKANKRQVTFDVNQTVSLVGDLPPIG